MTTTQDRTNTWRRSYSVPTAHYVVADGHGHFDRALCGTRFYGHRPADPFNTPHCPRCTAKLAHTNDKQR